MSRTEAALSRAFAPHGDNDRVHDRWRAANAGGTTANATSAAAQATANLPDFMLSPSPPQRPSITLQYAV